MKRASLECSSEAHFVILQCNLMLFRKGTLQIDRSTLSRFVGSIVYIDVGIDKLADRAGRLGIFMILQNSKTVYKDDFLLFDKIRSFLLVIIPILFPHR